MSSKATKIFVFWVKVKTIKTIKEMKSQKFEKLMKPKKNEKMKWFEVFYEKTRDDTWFWMIFHYMLKFWIGYVIYKYPRSKYFFLKEKCLIFFDLTKVRKFQKGFKQNRKTQGTFRVVLIWNKLSLYRFDLIKLNHRIIWIYITTSFYDHQFSVFSSVFFYYFYFSPSLLPF